MLHLHNIEPNQVAHQASRVPLMSLYTNIIIYLFLPIARKDVAAFLSLSVSLICLVMFVGIEVKLVSSLLRLETVEKLIVNPNNAGNHAGN